MAMQIEKTFTLRAPRAAVWDFLTDPEKVARCLPGAAITGKLDDGQSYGGTMTVKVGPVTANYRGKMRFDKLDETAGEAEIVASGQETRGKGGADMKMKSYVSERAPGETEVKVVSDVNVVGVLAQFGRGMIQDVSDQLFQKFTDCMRRELETPAAPEAAQSVAAAEKSQDAAASPVPAPPPAPPPAEENVLDVGALGAAAAGRAAKRTLSQPGFWIAAIALAVLMFWFFHC
jgi:carbon monoxide dehydrogenase subunit G